jgi:uncharacterized protein
MFQPRTYRHWVKSPDLVSFTVIVEETDCRFSAASNLESKARKSIIKYRAMLKKYIAAHPDFLTALEPFPVAANAPLIVKAMAEAGAQAGVGPMAAVAGAIADFVGQDLAPFSPELIIENGGDIFLHSHRDRVVGVYAGNSPLTGKIGLAVAAQDTPLGISTSSGTVGHSLSFGKADAVVILARTGTLSDAVATAVGNLVFTAGDIPKGLDHALRIPGVTGVVIIKDAELGVAGAVKLVKTAV